MIDTYIELFQLYQVYPRECRGLIYMLMFHQVMFLWVNVMLYSLAPFLLLILLDISWQSFLNIYMVNEMHYVWMKSSIEETNLGMFGTRPSE